MAATEDVNGEENYKKTNLLTIVSTNARSITPKIESFIEYLNELQSSIAFLTETWLTDSDHLEADIKDLELRTGYSLICKN